MKKFICLIALVCAFASVKAQDYAGALGPASVTHTNVQNDTISVTIPKSRTAITFKYDITVTSGTAAGTIVLQAKITAPGSAEQWTTLNTYTITNATATNSVALTANNYVSYRVITATTGVSVTVHKKWLLYRSYNQLN